MKLISVLLFSFSKQERKRKRLSSTIVALLDHRVICLFPLLFPYVACFVPLLNYKLLPQKVVANFLMAQRALCLEVQTYDAMKWNGIQIASCLLIASLLIEASPTDWT